MAEEKKKLRGRRAKLEQFSTNVNGEQIYNGAYYVAQGGADAHRYAQMVRWLLGPGATALLLAAGCLPVAGMMGQIYVILPYGLALLAAVSVAWAVARMTYWGYPLRAYVYEATVRAIPVRTMAAAVLAVLTAGGETLALFLHGAREGNLVPELVFLLLTLGAGACLFALWHFERRQRWSIQSRE